MWFGEWRRGALEEGAFEGEALCVRGWRDQLRAMLGDAPVGGGWISWLVRVVIVAMAGFFELGLAVAAVAVPAQEGAAVGAGVWWVGEWEWESVAGEAPAVGAEGAAIKGAGTVSGGWGARGIWG